MGRITPYPDARLSARRAKEWTARNLSRRERPYSHILRNDPAHVQPLREKDIRAILFLAMIAETWDFEHKVRFYTFISYMVFGGVPTSPKAVHSSQTVSAPTPGRGGETKEVIQIPGGAVPVIRSEFNSTARVPAIRHGHDQFTLPAAVIQLSMARPGRIASIIEKMVQATRNTPGLRRISRWAERKMIRRRIKLSQ